MIRRALLALALCALPVSAGGDFNGTTGFYELASDLGFDGDANFPCTVSAWVRPDTVSGIDSVFTIDDKGDLNGATLRLSSGVPAGNISSSGAGSDTSFSTSKTATAGRWYHVVAIFDDVAANCGVWVDGSFMGGGSGTNRTFADMDVVTIGCTFTAVPAAQEFFDGVVTRLAVWSVALTEGEIQSLTQGARPCNVRPGSLVHWIQAGTIDGTRCIDVVGGNSYTKNGTIAASSDDGPLAFRPPGLGSWTPASLTGLVVWLKGDAGVTGSAPVTAWADQSGAGNDLDNTGSGAPATASTGYNGKAGIAFTEDSLYGEPAPATAAPFYGLMVATTVAVDNGDTYIFLGDKDLNDSEQWRFRASSAAGATGWRANSVAGGIDDATGGGPGLEGGGVKSLEWDEATSTSRRVSENAGQQGTNTASNSPLGADRYSIGRSDDSTPDAGVANVTVYEFVLVTSAPSNADRINWFLYARMRWGVRGGPWRYE